MTSKFKMSKLTLAVSAAVLAALLWAPAAQAFLVGNGPGPGASSSTDLLPFDYDGLPTWYLYGGNNGSSPIPVSHDWGAGPWEKTLNLVKDGVAFPFTEGHLFEGNNGLDLNGLAWVIEFLTIDGDRAWTDWHETILTPGWEWVEFPPLYPLIVEQPGYILVPGLSYNLDSTATELALNFSPLEPGTQIEIFKLIQFVGFDSGNTQEITTSPVVISEYPTVPEPSTFILLGAGLAGLAFWRKKRA